MFQKILISTLLTGFIVFYACKPKQQVVKKPSETISKQAKAKKGPELKEAHIPVVIDSLVNNKLKEIAKNSVLRKQFKVDTHILLDSIYDTLQHTPVWDYKVFPEAIELLKDSRLDGLYSTDYDVDLLDSLLQVPAPTDSALSAKTAHIDVLLTQAYLKYGQHLVEGKTDPYHLDPNWNFSKRKFSAPEVDALLKAGKESKPQDFVKHCRPGDWYYASLMKWMKHSYDSSVAFLDTLVLKYPEKPLRKGDSSEVVRRLKYRLASFQSYAGTKPNGLFDDSLEVALKDFQKYRGLVSDGVAGKSTFSALQMTLEEQRDQIRVNMERARWILHDLPDEFLLVNIAAYKLYVFRNQKIDYQSNVVVGKLHHETPVFHSEIKYIQFNCTWTVPRSIAVNEILPRVKSNKSYLTSHHFDVLNSSGTILDYYSIDFSKYNKNNFPYTFRQQAGPYNALGTMKFIFPNKYSVYLHDTPSRYLFEKEGGRAFSHGCVRVQYPDKLAAELLKKNGMTEKDISRILERKVTQNISLKEPMPIFITYWTCFEGANKKHLYFLQDVYQRDAKILAALKK